MAKDYKQFITETYRKDTIMRTILTEEQCAASRRLYQSMQGADEVTIGYARTILAMLDTIDDLRAALKIERGEFQVPPTRVGAQR
jgi:hypothetical protein